MKINTESLIFSQRQIEIIEKHYSAKYVFETEIHSHAPCASIFWQPDPPNGYSNWMGVYRESFSGKTMITSGAPVKDMIITALKVGDDDYIYSHHAHHFCEKNGLAIDGGRGYTRLAGDSVEDCIMAKFKVTPDGLVMVS